MSVKDNFKNATRKMGNNNSFDIAGALVKALSENGMSKNQVAEVLNRKKDLTI